MSIDLCFFFLSTIVIHFEFEDIAFDSIQIKAKLNEVFRYESYKGGTKMK